MFCASGLLLLQTVVLLKLHVVSAREGVVAPKAGLVNPTLPPECEKHCDIRRCPVITKEICGGHIVKDKCDCCPQCKNQATEPITPVSTIQSANVSALDKAEKCKNVVCPKQRICMINIQGLPLCRCPSLYVCDRILRPICGRDGKTHLSRCHMRITACNRGRRLQMVHRGACANDPLDTKSLTPKQRRLYEMYVNRIMSKPTNGSNKPTAKQTGKKKVQNRPKTRLDRKRKKRLMKKKKKQLQKQRRRNRKNKLNRQQLHKRFRIRY